MNSSKFLCCGLSEIENIICPELPAKMRIDRENNSFHTYFLQVTVLIRLVSWCVATGEYFTKSFWGMDFLFNKKQKKSIESIDFW